MYEHERIAQRIDAIYKLRSSIGVENTFQIAQLANYTCILISAYLERAIVELIVDYCTKRGAGQVAAFVAAQIGRFQNPSSEKVVTLLRNFGEPVSSRLTSSLSDEMRSSIDSIVSNRNNLAHGRNATVTFSMLGTWDEQIRKFVSKLQNVILT